MKTLCIAAVVTAMAAITGPAAAQTATQPTVSGAAPAVGTKSRGDSAGNTGTTSTGSGASTGSTAASGSAGGKADATIGSGSTSVSGSGTEPAKASLSGSGNSVKSLPNNGQTVRRTDDRAGSTAGGTPTALPGSTNSVSPAAK